MRTYLFYDISSMVMFGIGSFACFESWEIGTHFVLVAILFKLCAMDSKRVKR